MHACRSITLEQLCPTLPESLDAAYTSLFSACLTPTVIAHHHTLLTALCLLTAAEEPLNLNQLVGHGVVLSDLTLLPLWGTLFFVAENKVGPRGLWHVCWHSTCCPCW
jgi:hypothetical protein